MFQKAVNMLEQMDTAESIYEGVAEPSYLKPTREYANRYGYIRNKRIEAALSQTHAVMEESSGKRRK